MANIKQIFEEKCLTINRPFVNVLKKYDLSHWKKYLSIGTISSFYDPQIKSTVYAISSSNPDRTNYIQLPKFSHQGLKLEGRYFYLNFLSDREKNYSIHVDCKLDNATRKISISPSFEDFKICKFSCRIPVVFVARKNGTTSGKVIKTCARRQMFVSVGEDTKWTTMCLDLGALGDLAWHETHSYVKGLKFCGEISISHVFFSDYLFVPQHLLQEVMTPLCYAFPGEMSFPLGKGEQWKDFYNFVCFPQNTCTDPDCKHNHLTVEKKQGVSEASKRNEADANEDDEWMERSSSSSSDNEGGQSSSKSSLSDPVLHLEHALGFGGANMKHVVMDSNATRVIYPCNALLVLQYVNTGVQKFMIGHTDKISCLSVDRGFQLLASAQSGNPGLVRVWSVEMMDCLAVLNPGGLTVNCLSLSRSGRRLCCLGKDAHYKNVIVVWNISNLGDQGEVKVVCRGRTEVQIAKMMMMMMMTLEFDDFSEERMISCGHGNIRLWRTKDGHLKSTPIDLSRHHAETFVDLGFEVEAEPSEFTERTMELAYSRAYACTKSFLVFEIDCISISILSIIDFKATSLNNNNLSIVPSSLLVTQNYFCFGSTCGRLRLSTREGSVDLFETVFEGSIEVVRSSNDCVRILVGRSDGNLGLLNLRSRELEPLQSSMGRKIMKCSLDGRTFSMSTLSADGSIRIWSLFDMLKPRCCLFPSRDAPAVCIFHPRLDLLFVGCGSGRFVVFETERLQHLTSFKPDDSPISDLIFNSEGTLLYSCSSTSANLALHRIHVTNGDSEQEAKGQDVNLDGGKIIFNRLRTLLGVLPAETPGRSCGTLSISSDGSVLVNVGPARSTISVRDSSTLNEVKRIEMKAITKVYDWRAVSRCQHVTFSLGSSTSLIIQSGEGCIYTYDYLNDETIRQLDSPGAYGIVPMVSTLEGSDVIALACDKMIKVYIDNSSSHCQHFIGHSEPISQVLFDPVRSALVTVGDAVLIWKFKSNGEGNYLNRSLQLERQLPDREILCDTSRNLTSISFRRFDLSSSEEDDDDDDVGQPRLPTTIRRITNHASSRRHFKNSARETADFIGGINLSSIKRRYARIKT